MTFEEYLKIDAINASFLKACSFGKYAGYKYLHEKKFESDAMAFGTAVHTVLLEPEKFLSQYAFMEKVDLRTKAGKEYQAKFQSENEGKIVLDSSDNFKLQKIQDRCKEIPIIQEALNTFEKEKTYVWENTSHKFKARLDLVNEKSGVIIDVKTTKDASERGFIKQFIDLRYDVQFYHYASALSLKSSCYVIAIESETQQVALYNIDEIIQSNFTATRYQQALNTAYEVLELKEEPLKYPTEILKLTLPKWVSEAV